MTDERGLGVVHSTIGTAEDVIERPEVIKILKMLIQHRASVSAADHTKEERCPIHYCAIFGNYKAAQLLLSEDVRIINQSDKDGKTALYHACAHHSPNPDMIELLLLKGATLGGRKLPRMKHGPKRERIVQLFNDAGRRRRSR